MWAIYSGLRVFAWGSPYGFLGQSWELLFDFRAAEALAIGLLIWLAGSRIGKWPLQCIAVVNAALQYGLLDNLSMSGCLSIASIPLFFGEHWIFQVGLLISALMTGQSQPLGMAILLYATLLFRGGYRWLTALFVMLSWLIAYLIAGKTLFDNNGRSTIWLKSWEWWKIYDHPWIGAGLGSFSVIGNELSKNLPGRFIWLHSDWAQLAFEQGMIGLALTIGFFVFLLWKSWYRKDLFFGILLFGAYGCFNMPLHYPIAALYLSYLINQIVSEVDV